MVTHRMCVCTQITWTWLCTRGKKRYKYCSFSHTNRSFRVLGHQCVVTMGNCLIWISLCMFFFPLIETVTYTCHYMTDRLERFDLKTSKLDLLKKKRPGAGSMGWCMRLGPALVWGSSMHRCLRGGGGSNRGGVNGLYLGVLLSYVVWELTGWWGGVVFPLLWGLVGRPGLPWALVWMGLGPPPWADLG